MESAPPVQSLESLLRDAERDLADGRYGLFTRLVAMFLTFLRTLMETSVPLPTREAAPAAVRQPQQAGIGVLPEAVAPKAKAATASRRARVIRRQARIGTAEPAVGNAAPARERQALSGPPRDPGSRGARSHRALDRPPDKFAKIAFPGHPLPHVHFVT